jgi:hypothetical protein
LKALQSKKKQSCKLYKSWFISSTEDAKEKRRSYPSNAGGQRFISELGHRITAVTDDPRETSFLFQRLSVAIQRYNAVSLANSFQTSDAIDDTFCVTSLPKYT